VALLLQAGADASAKNAYGSTPLHVACAARASEACKALVAAGAGINAVNNGGWTPLHYAIRGGEHFNDPSLIQWLVSHGAKSMPQPMSSAVTDVYPHPAAMSPTAHGMFQG